MNETLITIFLSVFTCTGFWAFVTAIYQSRSKKLDNKDKLVMGIAHDRICFLGEQYIRRGSISKDDYESLNKYLYEPYKALGGNGTAEKIMREVDKLELREVSQK